MIIKDITYYGTGGVPKYFFEPQSSRELAEVMKEISARKLPYFLLGAGSNSLVMDEPFDGAVVYFGKMLNIAVSEPYLLSASAGVTNSQVAQTALDHGWAGAAWMHRLPGQVGATVRMNARCYGGEISQIADKIETVTPSGELKRYPAQGLFYGYKDTAFMKNREIIARVWFQLRPGEASIIKAEMQNCEQDRIAKNQFSYPSCGCVFKNNYKIGVPSGMLLAAANVFKFSTPRAMINPKHANFIFNIGASSREILELSLKMREEVYRVFGVFLEYEMEILGTIPDDLRSKLAVQKPNQTKEAKLKKLREDFKSRLKGS